MDSPLAALLAMCGLILLGIGFMALSAESAVNPAYRGVYFRRWRYARRVMSALSVLCFAASLAMIYGGAHA